MRNLEYLELHWDLIESVPFCVGDLVKLKQLLFDVDIELKYIPLSIFNLPELRDLSLFQLDISYNNLLTYNLPQDIDDNDTDATNAWFNDNFKWNPLDQTNYWLR